MFFTHNVIYFVKCTDLFFGEYKHDGTTPGLHSWDVVLRLKSFTFLLNIMMVILATFYFRLSAGTVYKNPVVGVHLKTLI